MSYRCAKKAFGEISSVKRLLQSSNLGAQGVQEIIDSHSTGLEQAHCRSFLCSSRSYFSPGPPEYDAETKRKILVLPYIDRHGHALRIIGAYESSYVEKFATVFDWLKDLKESHCSILSYVKKQRWPGSSP